MCKCSPGLVTRVKQYAYNTQVKNNSSAGRPTIMLSAHEMIVRKWLEDRVANKQYPTKREFEEKCIDLLALQNFTGNWSSSYFNKLLKRTAPEFECKQSQPLEQERYQVTKESINEFFQKLQDLYFSDILPNLIINIDETGLGNSR